MKDVFIFLSVDTLMIHTEVKQHRAWYIIYGWSSIRHASQKRRSEDEKISHNTHRKYVN